MKVSHVLRDRNKVLNRKHLFPTTSRNVNKHPSMRLHIFTEAITNKPYYQSREVSSAHSLICYAPYWKEYARPAALFLINFWHHFSLSALGMQGVKFIVAGLIFHLAKMISLQRFYLWWNILGWLHYPLKNIDCFLLSWQPLSKFFLSCHPAQYMAGIISC